MVCGRQTAGESKGQNREGSQGGGREVIVGLMFRPNDLPPSVKAI